MSTSTNTTQRQSLKVKIRNPIPGGAEYMTRKRAEQRVDRGLGYFHPSTGEFVFTSRNRGVQHTRLEVSAFKGCDARPGMPVLPPSPEVLAKLSSRPRSAAEVLCARAERNREARMDA